MKKVITIAILSCTLLSACSGARLGTSENVKYKRVLAKLVDYSVVDGFIYIDVMSNGCTFITNFELMLLDKKDNSLQVIQTKPDPCFMGSIKLSLNYSFRHLGLDQSRPIKVVNQLLNENLLKNKLAQIR